MYLCEGIIFFTLFALASVLFDDRKIFFNLLSPELKKIMQTKKYMP